MKVPEGGVIPGLDGSVTFSTGGEMDETVSNICESELERMYDESWLSDVFRRVDATNLKEDKYSVPIQSGYYNGGSGMVTFDKFARGVHFTDGWDNQWLEKIINSIETEAIEQIRETCPVVNNEGMTESECTEHFKEEYGFHNAEQFYIKPNVYLYASPDMFGYDVVRRDWDVEHRCSLKTGSNYAIASTRRGFLLNATGVIYDLRSESER